MNYLQPNRISSIKLKMIVSFLVASVPLIILLIYFNLYSIDLVRSQVADSNKGYVSVYMKQIDSSLDEIDRSLVELFIQDRDVWNLGLEKTSYPEYYFAKTRVMNKLSTAINHDNAVDAFFIYSAINDELINTPLDQYPFEVREALKQKMFNVVTARTTLHVQDDWNTLDLNEHHFIYRLIQRDQVMISALVSVQKLMQPMNKLDEDQGVKALMTTKHFKPLNNEDFVREHQIRLDYHSEPFILSGDRKEYLVVGQPSSKGDFHLVTLVSDKIILDKLPFLQTVIWVIAGIAVFSLMGYIYMLGFIILKPISDTIQAMRLLRKGHLDTRIPYRKSSQEFLIMHETFNSMASDIQSLKIEVYEEQLKSQKAELKHLQLQINPHFFMNSLNIIYSLAQVKDYKLIIEMIQCLMKYFRFMFHGNKSALLPLHEEIEHSENYLRIQQLRYPSHLTYEFEITEPFRDVQVPPLMIQHFIENSIKHAITTEDPIHIRVSVLAQEIEGFLKIVIEDTGDGFSQEVLKRIRNEVDLDQENGEQLGIRNAIHRLRLLYGQTASIAFSNGRHKGAVVEINLPLHAVSQ